MSLNPILNRLEAWLQEAAPAVHASLQPGLGPAEFKALTTGLPFALPPQLAELYAWHDGQTAESVLFDYFSFYPLATALGEYQQLRTVSQQLEADHGFGFWPEGRLPLFGFEGEYFVLDCVPDALDGSHKLWFHFIEDSPRYWFNSLEQMLEFLTQAFEKGLYRLDADGQCSADAKGLHGLRLKLVSPDADQQPLHALSDTE
ncbi:MAG: hypothetical protein CVV27_07420 [Candidatus Melainabacteria bacterium HGW-Melainabacteria-1]|nr:MAG: hypothetical protein CVV27_07420 [Candidatus Melainabacteria bacterium HGW-Melainabacteria-1]